jgi:hypothetical protein
MSRLINWFVAWFLSHWQQRIFKNSIIFVISVFIFHLFWPKVFHDLMVFIFLIVIKDLITNIVKNDAFVTALGIGLAGIIVGIFKKWNNKDDN